MSARTARVTAAAAGLVSLTTLLLALASVRPAGAAPRGRSFALTYGGSAAGPAGGVGASGGLVVLDGGPAWLSGRLDSSPSASAAASSVEPGTMARLVVGQANGAGAPGVSLPTTARADHPGETGDDDATLTGERTLGPVTVAGGQAVAHAGDQAASSRAGLGRLAIVGGAGSRAALSAALASWRRRWVAPAAAPASGVAAPSATGDPAPPLLALDDTTGTGRADDTDAPTAQAEVRIGRVRILGSIILETVAGRATVALGDAGAPTAEGSFTVGAATIGGVPVTIDDRGVRVADRDVVAGGEVDAASAALAKALERSGVALSLLAPTEQTGDHDASASSGGLRVTLTTPSNQGVPRNVVALVLGRVTTTLTAAGAPAATVGGTASLAGAPVRGTDAGTSVGSGPSDLPAAAGSAAPPPVDAPEVAPPADGTGRVVVAGRTVSVRTAYAGFAAWLLFTFTLPVLIALTVGRATAPGALEGVVA